MCGGQAQWYGFTLADQDRSTAAADLKMQSILCTWKAMLSCRHPTSKMRMTALTPLEVDRKGWVLKARDSSAPSDAASTAPARKHVSPMSSCCEHLKSSEGHCPADAEKINKAAIMNTSTAGESHYASKLVWM